MVIRPDEPEISAALAAEIASWRRTVHLAAPADGRELLRRAANDLCAAAAIDATVHPSAETRALARQAIFDALDEFADYLGIAPDDAQQIFADAMDTAYSTPAGDKARPRAELRIIRVQRGKLHEVVRETEEALIAAGLVFFRGGVLVQPVFRRERSRLTNQYAVLSVCLRLTAPLLSNTIALHAAAYQAQSRHRRGESLLRSTRRCPRSTRCWRGPRRRSFPTLTGIINSPTMRPNGSLLTTTAARRDDAALVPAER